MRIVKTLSIVTHYPVTTFKNEQNHEFRRRLVLRSGNVCCGNSPSCVSKQNKNLQMSGCSVHITCTSMGAETARVRQVPTPPTFGILTWNPPKISYSKVLIKYIMNPTLFSTPGGAPAHKSYSCSIKRVTSYVRKNESGIFNTD